MPQATSSDSSQQKNTQSENPNEEDENKDDENISFYKKVGKYKKFKYMWFSL